MNEAIHPLLARQLRRLGLAEGQVPDAAAFAQLLHRVSATYADGDQERYLLDRSQTIASKELAELNRELLASKAQLASLLALSTDWVWEQDEAGRFTYVSEDLLRRTPLRPEDLLGQACSVDGPLRVAAEAMQRLQARLSAWEPFDTVTFEARTGDGRTCHMSISGEPVLEQGVLRGYRGVGSDVTEAVEADRRNQETARRRLQAQLDFSSRLLEVSPTPLFVKDERGRFVTVNAAWLDLMGFRLDEVVGRDSNDLFGTEGLIHNQRDEQLLQSEDRVRYENRLDRPGREPRDTVVTKVRFIRDDGSPAGIVGSIIDVTEFRDAERATHEARDAAERADRAKTEFIANVSHELRTPLQSIIGFSELGVTRASNEPRWLPMFRSIHDGGIRMLKLVNELLDLSKAGDMSVGLELRQQDLATLVDEVVTEVWPLAAPRQLRVEVRHGIQPLTASVDAFRIQQVVRNVLANALRFSPQGGVIELLSGPAADGGVVISVRDHGPGIPPSELESIFDPFIQSSRTRDGSGGTGLGLTISRRIMQLHGGSIQAANAEGGGACMTIRLPPCPAGTAADSTVRA